MPLPRNRLGLGEIGAARATTYLAFFNLGVGAGLWAVFIPVVRARLGIEEGIIGLALLAIAIGAMIAMPIAGVLIGRAGARRIAAWAAVLMPIAAALPILAPSLPVLFVVAVLFGAGNGILDVAMNTEAARVEAAMGRPAMSAFHGLYSVGGLFGAGTAALFVAVGAEGGWAASAMAAGLLAVLAGAAALVMDWYLPDPPVPAQSFRFTLPSRALVGLGLLAFLCFGLEGAVADWSALFLERDRAAGPVVAALGFAFFAGSMAVMRLVGDPLVGRFGRQRMVAIGGVVIAIGGAIAILAPWPPVAAVGFGLVGLGAANIVPVILGTAGRYPRGSGGVAAVSTIGYVGILLWPPVIGGIAHISSLELALSLIAVAGLVIALRTAWVRDPSPQ